MTSEDLEAALRGVGSRFDLGEYEVETYVAVLDHGRLTASRIADETGVPQPRVYDTVRSLADRGLVELREGRPIEVVAIDPADAFGDVQSSLADLVASLEEQYTAPTDDAEAVSLVRSRATILRYLSAVVDAADYELALSLTPDLLARFEDHLAERRADGVDVELLVSPAGEVPDPGEYDYGSVATAARARAGRTTPVVAVADGDYSVYATRSALVEGRDRYGVIFDRSALGFLVAGFFNTILWTTADPLLQDGGDRSFPRRYASIRRCVRDLRGRDDTVYATVEGRDVASGSLREVRGEVVDVAHHDAGEIAAITVATGDGRVAVGGRVAALEDVEAHEIRIGRRNPPE